MVAALLLGACGDDEYDAKALADDLRADTELTTEQADCVVVGLERRLGENRVGARFRITFARSDDCNDLVTGAI